MIALQRRRRLNSPFDEEAAKYDEIYCEYAPNEKAAFEAIVLHRFLELNIKAFEPGKNA